MFYWENVEWIRFHVDCGCVWAYTWVVLPGINIFEPDWIWAHLEHTNFDIESKFLKIFQINQIPKDFSNVLLCFLKWHVSNGCDFVHPDYEFIIGDPVVWISRKCSVRSLHGGIGVWVLHPLHACELLELACSHKTWVWLELHCCEERTFVQLLKLLFDGGHVKHSVVECPELWKWN